MIAHFGFLPRAIPASLDAAIEAVKDFETTTVRVNEPIDDIDVAWLAEGLKSNNRIVEVA